MVIDTETEKQMVRYAAEVLGQAQNIVAFTGQGISPIPDTGQEWINFERFLANPQQVWQEVNRQRQLIRTARPTPAHHALAEMEFVLEKFLLITQNTDGLHQAACSTRLVEIHGNLRRARCIQCDYETEEFDLSDRPQCPLCDHWLRPDVVWADEPLPAEEFAAACEACELADLILSIGNQAEVQPSRLPHLAGQGHRKLPHRNQSHPHRRQPTWPISESPRNREKSSLPSSPY